MKAFKISAILSFIIMMVGLVGVVFLGGLQSYVQMIAGIVWFVITMVRIKKGRPLKGKVSDYLAGRILVFLLLVFFGAAIVSPIPKGNAFQYPFQMKYLGNHGYQNNFFPERLPDKVENYEMDFMPSIMQGSGWTKVSFKTDAVTIAAYKNELKTRDCEAELLEEHKGLVLLEHHLPKQMKGNLQSCQIYVMRFKDDWNHPHIECVVLNEVLGYVMFFEM